MDDAGVRHSAPARASDGRVPGRRGRATRRRLLDETKATLALVPYRDLRVVDITRRAGTSPATFYQYFTDAESAVLCLAEELVDEGSQELRALVADARWESPGAARALADGFLAFFESHEPVLRVMDLATAEGDERFHGLRVRLLNGVFSAIQDLVAEARARGRLGDDADPGAIASVLTTMLAHVAAHSRGYESWGVRRDALAATMARMVDAALRGPARSAPSG